MRHTGLILKLTIGFCVVLPAAFADLIQSSPFEVNIGGTGFGNVSTLITLQTANGQSTSEAGCIGFQNSVTNCGMTQIGTIKNSSTLEPLPPGITDASDLRFVFNASQPAGGSITLQSLEVSFFGASGDLYTANLLSSLLPLTLSSTIPGTGQSGFAFQLDPSEVSSVNALLSSVSEIGAGFSATGASGGQDTLFLETVSASPSSVPEPASYLLLGIALLCGLLLKTKFGLNHLR